MNLLEKIADIMDTTLISFINLCKKIRNFLLKHERRIDLLIPFSWGWLLASRNKSTNEYLILLGLTIVMIKNIFKVSFID